MARYVTEQYLRANIFGLAFKLRDFTDQFFTDPCYTDQFYTDQYFMRANIFQTSFLWASILWTCSLQATVFYWPSKRIRFNQNYCSLRYFVLRIVAKASLSQKYKRNTE